MVWEVPSCGSGCFFHQFVGSHQFMIIIQPNYTLISAGFSFAESSQDLFPSEQRTGTVNDDI
jgi:hypothetical protein